METFGSHLKKLRKQKKVTLQALAKSLKVSIAYIHQLETDKTSPPNIKRCRQLAKALEIDFNVLWRIACAQQIEKKVQTRLIADNEFAPAVLSSSERKLIKILRALDNNTRLKLLAHLRDLIANHPDEITLILIADFLENGLKDH